MSFFGDCKETAARFQHHIQAFEKVYKKHGLSFGSPGDIWKFIKKLKNERTFRQEIVALGNSLLKREAGKISLTVLFTIIALSIGGIGIAGLGTAFGIPVMALTTILGALGFGIGQEVDTVIRGELAESSVHASQSNAFDLAEILEAMDVAVQPLVAHSIFARGELERHAIALNNLNQLLNDATKAREKNMMVQSDIMSKLSQINAHLEVDMLAKTEATYRQLQFSRQLMVAVCVLGGLALACAIALSIVIIRLHLIG